MVPGKPITPEGIAADFAYVVHGTPCDDVLEHVCRPVSGLRTLEPGCGSGKFSLRYALLGAVCRLEDIDSGVLEYTRALLAHVEKAAGRTLNVVIEQGSIFSLCQRLGKRQYDFTFNEGVPHHWPSPGPRQQRYPMRQRSISEMVGVTVPGGKVCIMGSNALSSEMMEYAARISHTYAGMPPTQQPFTPEELQGRLMRAGLVRVEVHPVYDSDWRHSTLLAGWGDVPWM